MDLHLLIGTDSDNAYHCNIEKRMSKVMASNFLERLSFQLLEKTKDIIDNCGFDFNKESAYYATLGMKKENAYLYVRGHCLYNSLVSMGSKLCEDTAVDFEQNILKPVLAFEEYDEISEIKKRYSIIKDFKKRLVVILGKKRLLRAVMIVFV